MESQILTPHEVDTLIGMFNEQNKFNDIGTYEYKLLYASYKHGIGEDIFKKICHDQKHLIVLIHAKQQCNDEDQGNVWGGYTSLGWRGIQSWEMQADDKAFLFSIRSKKAYPPKIFNVVKPSRALYNQKNYYCMLGASGIYWIDRYGHTGGTYNKAREASDPDLEYEALPHDYYLTGSQEFDVEAIEVFQLRVCS